MIQSTFERSADAQYKKGIQVAKSDNERQQRPPNPSKQTGKTIGNTRQLEESCFSYGQVYVDVKE